MQKFEELTSQMSSSQLFQQLQHCYVDSKAVAYFSSSLKLNPKLLPHCQFHALLDKVILPGSCIACDSETNIDKYIQQSNVYILRVSDQNQGKQQITVNIILGKGEKEQLVNSLIDQQNQSKAAVNQDKNANVKMKNNQTADKNDIKTEEHPNVRADKRDSPVKPTLKSVQLKIQVPKEIQNLMNRLKTNQIEFENHQVNNNVEQQQVENENQNHELEEDHAEIQGQQIDPEKQQFQEARQNIEQFITEEYKTLKQKFNKQKDQSYEFLMKALELFTNNPLAENPFSSDNFKYIDNGLNDFQALCTALQQLQGDHDKSRCTQVRQLIEHNCDIIKQMVKVTAISYQDQSNQMQMNQPQAPHQQAQTVQLKKQQELELIQFNLIHNKIEFETNCGEM